MTSIGSANQRGSSTADTVPMMSLKMGAFEAACPAALSDWLLRWTPRETVAVSRSRPSFVSFSASPSVVAFFRGRWRRWPVARPAARPRATTPRPPTPATCRPITTRAIPVSTAPSTAALGSTQVSITQFFYLVSLALAAFRLGLIESILDRF